MGQLGRKLEGMTAVVLAAEAVRLKARLQQKGEHRPSSMIDPLLPDGSNELTDMPKRARGGAEADAQYIGAVAKVAGVFGRQRRNGSTAKEHTNYMRVIDEYLIRQGFGSYVVKDFDDRGKLVQVRAQRDEEGTIKVRSSRAGVAAAWRDGGVA